MNEEMTKLRIQQTEHISCPIGDYLSVGVVLNIFKPDGFEEGRFHNFNKSINALVICFGHNKNECGNLYLFF